MAKIKLLKKKLEAGQIGPKCVKDIRSLPESK